MPATVNAIVTRKRGINGEFAHGQIIPLPAGQFEDWRSLGWVDRATAEQVAAAKSADEAPVKSKPSVKGTGNTKSEASDKSA